MTLRNWRAALLLGTAAMAAAPAMRPWGAATGVHGIAQDLGTDP